MTERLTDVELALCRMFAALWDAFQQGVGIDAMDVETILDHSSLAVWLPATEADVQANEGLEIEVGDKLLTLTVDGRRLAREGRRFLQDQPPKPE
jgi:hypothetical protein